ncbi:EAL domain-containing protein [Methylovorus glucosotrophus]|uniref:Diguanylate cyclase/phosphodiesterase n=1 Tax=Methylovorus glucosotrophus (strain SIP3-4) TaxID=582744 RepID=C6XDB6_METGS|nr:EAL domain-containing protein [Methylovorus glucosotrophus]ACT50541.1 diguanylate cyclase/phosphodiesterase [Methylovorus glucosotrophus SIP3-4]
MKLYLNTHYQTLNITGGKAIASFECADEAALLAQLEAITKEYPAAALDEALVYLAESDNSASLEAALADIMPFRTFYARRRYPWLLDDLEQHVQMHFQPIVDFSQNGKIFGYEALCRLRDPDGHLLNGEEAFQLARQVRRTMELDIVCQRLALAGKANSIAKGIPVFVNVLPQTIMRDDWLPPLLETLTRLGIEQRDVVVEIVESEDVSPELLAKYCDIIRTHGLRIALDDMGSGFNGLRALAAVRADFIKIDRAIVHEAQGSRVRTVLLEAIISMAQRLGCTVVAEGLERVEDITYCQDLGLTYAQGYYFAKPQQKPVSTVNSLPTRDESHRSHIPDEFRITEYVTRGMTMDVNTPIDQARRTFLEFPDVAMAVVLDGQRPIGLLKRGKAFSYRNLALSNYCDPLPRMVTNRMPTSMLARGLYLERGEVEPWVMVHEDGTYIGILQPLEILSQLISRKTSTGSLHPLSQLTTGPTLRQSLDISLRNNPTTELVYIDLDHFKAYNDRYGFIRGDAMIRLLSEIVRQEFQGRVGMLVGHIGGDDFVLILDHYDPDLPQTLLSVIHHFQTLAIHLYDESDLQRGFFTTEDGKEHPVASVSIAVVNGKQGRLSNSVAAAERAATLKKIGKSNIGSIIVVEDEPPQLILPETEDYSDWQGRALEALRSLLAWHRSEDAHCLDSCFSEYPFFEVVFELDDKGVQRYPNWINPNMYGKIKAGGAGVDRSPQAYANVVLQSLKPYISSIYLSTATEDFCLTVSLPMLDDTGRLTGILVADISIAAMAMLSST